MTEKLYNHLYPEALRAIVKSLDTQVQDGIENEHLLDKEDIEEREYMLSELKKVLQIHVNYFPHNTEINELAASYGITKNND